VYSKTVSSTLTLERETLHISDDTGRIGLIDTRTTGSGIEPAQLLRYQHSNHLSTATLELDDAAAIISYEEYYPYGSTSFQSGRSGAEVSLKRYRYTGKERDEESGLYYHGARYYIPWLCRWSACDPLESKYAGMSPYNYSFNNPEMYSDPNGMDGVYMGTGTQEDPYVIQANYYYSGLSKVEEKAFKEAVDEYNGVDKKNPNGKMYDIKIDKLTTIYVKFELTAINYDLIEQNVDEPLNLQQIAAKDGIAIYDKDGINTEYYRYGNRVEIGNVNEQNKFASANQESITFDRSNSEQYFSNHPSESIDYLDFAKAIFIHEIGHTLTAVHGDPGSIMNYTMVTEAQNLSVAFGNKGTGKYDYSLSKVDNKAIRAIIGRLGQEIGTPGNKSKYLAEKEKREKNYIFKELNNKTNKTEDVKQFTNSRIMKKQ